MRHQNNFVVYVFECRYGGFGGYLTTFHLITQPTLYKKNKPNGKPDGGRKSRKKNTAITHGLTSSHRILSSVARSRDRKRK